MMHILVAKMKYNFWEQIFIYIVKTFSRIYEQQRFILRYVWKQTRRKLRTKVGEENKIIN